MAHLSRAEFLERYVAADRSLPFDEVLQRPGETFPGRRRRRRYVGDASADVMGTLSEMMARGDSDALMRKARASMRSSKVYTWLRDELMPYLHARNAIETAARRDAAASTTAGFDKDDPAQVARFVQLYVERELDARNVSEPRFPFTGTSRDEMHRLLLLLRGSERKGIGVKVEQAGGVDASSGSATTSSSAGDAPHEYSGAASASAMVLQPTPAAQLALEEVARQVSDQLDDGRTMTPEQLINNTRARAYYAELVRINLMRQLVIDANRQYVSATTRQDVDTRYVTAMFNLRGALART